MNAALMARPTGRTIILGWIAVSMIAELLAAGFALVAMATTLSGVLTAAAIEGVLLALGQRVLLQPAAGRRFVTAWAIATLAGALIGRTLEYGIDVGPAASVASHWHPVVQVVGGVALGFLIGACMALPQTLVLQRRTARPWTWLLTRALAWAIALPLLLLAGSLVTAFSATSLTAVGTSVLTVVAVAALVAGAIEGTVMASLVRRLTPGAPLPAPGAGVT